MTIFELYKKYGIRTIANYSTPQIGILKEFPIAKDVAYYYTGDFTDTVPPEKNWVAEGINKKITVFTPEVYTSLYGKARKKYALRAVLKPYVRSTEKYFYTKNISKLDVVSVSLPVVISYAHLNKMYVRSTYIGSNLDTVKSVLGSVTKDVTKGIIDRTTFIDIKLPNKVDTVNDYINLLKKSITYYSKHYNTFEEFTLFELIKFIMYDHRDGSIFKDLMDIDNKKNVYFMLRTGGRFTLISVYDLLAMDDRNVDSKLGKHGKVTLKVFVKYILSIILNTPVEEEDLDKAVDSLKDKIIKPSKDTTIKLNKTAKEAALEEVVKNESKGLINEKQATKLKEVIRKSKNDITRTEADYKLENIEVPDSTIVLDKRALKDPIGARDRKYLKEQYAEDTKRVIEHLNVSGVVAVTNHEVIETNNKINSIETHKITILQANGRTKELIKHVPKPNEDGAIRLNNNEYMFIKQKLDRPIRKISRDVVALTSNFGKLMVTRGKYSKDNISKGIFRLLKSMNDDTELPLSLLVEGKGKFKNAPLPYWYGRTASTVQSFVIGDMFFTFDYTHREKYVKDLDKIEKFGLFVGNKGKTPMVIKGDMLYTVTDKPKELGNFLEVIGIDEDRLPLEQVSIGIRGKSVPLILPLLSYMSLDDLLTLLKIKYTIHSSARDSDVQYGEYIISFKDTTYKFSRSDKVATLLLSGLHSIRKELKFYSVKEISTVSGFSELYNMLGYNKGDLNELSLLQNMYIDPLTADILKLIKEPTSFPELLLRANELLLDYEYSSVNNIDGTVLKSYERINGMLYHTMVKEIRAYKNSIGITNGSIVSDPYAVMKLMNEDGSRELVEDINPIASLKQKENTTMLGFLGRSKESVPIEAREMDVSEVGILSEASKESAAVGITAYMSSSPSIKDGSGINERPKELSPFNVSSTASNLSPFAETDDGKRKLFNSVQAGSVIALNNQRVMPILTGYEAVLPGRVDDKFVTSAEDDGVVTSVGNVIAVKYKNGSSKKFSLANWFSKESGGESYMHTMRTLFAKGDKFKKGDTLVYDSTFFGPNVFDKGKVLYKTGMPVRIALFESIANYEDSTSISKKLSSRASSDLVKVRYLVVDGSNDLIDFKQIGDKVEYTTPLIINRNISDINSVDKKMEKKTLDILKDIVSDIPKAEVDGTIENITVYYRKELKEYKSSLRKFIEASDERLMKEFGYTGKVDHTYSSNGEPLEENDIEIKYFIRYTLPMAHRDKGVLQNQLKFTAGEVFDKIVSEDGDEVEITMSPTSIDARVVDSAYRGIALTTLMMKLTEDVIKMHDI